jgi:hypothetical protein
VELFSAITDSIGTVRTRLEAGEFGNEGASCEGFGISGVAGRSVASVVMAVWFGEGLWDDARCTRWHLAKAEVARVKW